MPPVFETMLGPVEVSGEVVKEIISVELANCFHWICPSIDLDYDSVMDFLEGKRDPGLLRRVARYILVYAENLVLTNYVYQRILNPGNADRYLESMKPFLKELRRLYGLLQRKPYDVYRPLVDEMLNLCLRYGIDPF